MSKEGLKSKPKKVKKLKKDAKVVPEMKSQEEAPTAESYVAGEVAGSLFSKTSNQDTTPLLSLFDIKACAVQPLYVPVVVTKTKPVETEAPKPSKSSAVAPQVSAKKSKKELSEAEKKVEDRERALTDADADEETKRSTDKNLKTKKRLADEETVAELAQKKRRIMAEERVKNKRTVFVGNLPVSCTKQMLKSCFKDFGHIESMRFRSVARADPTESRKVAAIHRKVHPKRKSINAYIVFKEQESASKALARNGNEISSGFHIRVDLASKSSSHDKKKTVFVGNLPYDIHDEALREHFSECGTVDGVRIIRDQYSGIGKGFGYVLFQASDAVQLALKLENSELMGRKIRVKRCLTTDAQKTPKQAPAKQSAPGKKAPFQKKNTFVGETADGAVKRKNKKPKMKKKKINL